jgi:hypothetical protein
MYNIAAPGLRGHARAVDPTVKVLIANVVTRAPLCGFDNINSTIATYSSDLASAVPGIGRRGTTAVQVHRGRLAAISVEHLTACGVVVWTRGAIPSA